MADYQGTDGDDRYHGSDGYDTIAGYDGDDRLWGEDGPDTIYGGLGRDVLRGGDGDDRISGGPGADRMFGGRGNDIFELAARGDRIDGGAGDDQLWFAYDTNPVLHTAAGGEGIDTIRFDGARFDGRTGALDLTGFEHIADGSTLYSTFKEDSVIDLSSLTSASFATDTLRITGADGDGRLTVTGGAERDVITGSAGDDVLNGGAGDDWLIGFVGADPLIGGDGVDTVEVRVAKPHGATISLLEGTCEVRGEIDRLEGIENVLGTGFADRIRGDDGANRLDGGYGDWTQDGVQHFTFIGEAAFSGAAGELRVTATGGAALLSADLNGDAEADYVVRLDGASTLTAADLILAPAATEPHEPLMLWWTLAIDPHVPLA